MQHLPMQARTCSMHASAAANARRCMHQGCLCHSGWQQLHARWGQHRMHAHRLEIRLEGRLALHTVSLFLARMFIMACWCLLSGLTPGRYPTSARSTGVSLNNSICRVGGFISPYIVILARKTAWPHSPEAVFCGLAVAAAAASAVLLMRQQRVQAVADTLLPLQRGGGAQQQGSFLSFVAAQLSGRSSHGGSMVLPVTAPSPVQQALATPQPRQQQLKG